MPIKSLIPSLLFKASHPHWYGADVVTVRARPWKIHGRRYPSRFTVFATIASNDLRRLWAAFYSHISTVNITKGQHGTTSRGPTGRFSVLQPLLNQHAASREHCRSARKCREHAAQLGLAVAPEFEFADEAVSGTKRA